MTPISLIISTSLTPRVYLGWFFGIEKGCESLDSHPLFVAEREGFEPPEARTSTVFKTAAIDHSATSPYP